MRLSCNRPTRLRQCTRMLGFLTFHEITLFRMHVILSQLSLTSVENVLNKQVRKMFLIKIGVIIMKYQSVMFSKSQEFKMKI